MSSYVWCGFFLGPKIYKIWKARKQAGNYHQDRLSQIIQQYPGLGKRYTAFTHSQLNLAIVLLTPNAENGRP
jgi:hypothetical protein